MEEMPLAALGDRTAAFVLIAERAGTGVPTDSALAKAVSKASDATGDGGIGMPKGMTSEISELARRPRCVRKSCASRALSRLEAGGHLNGAEVTPTTRPPYCDRPEEVKAFLNHARSG